MEKLLTTNQLAKLLNVWPETLRRWEREGKLKPLRTPGGHRRYKESQIMALIGEEITVNETKQCAIYARVSTAKQAEAGNLQRQKERLIAYAVEKGYQVKAIYTEIASGLNENRRELAKLAKTATKGEIDVIVIEYKDRLARFGYKYLEQYYLRTACKTPPSLGRGLTGCKLEISATKVQMGLKPHLNQVFFIGHAVLKSTS